MANRETPTKGKPTTSATLTVKDIFDLLCPDCQGKLADSLVALARQSLCREAIEKQLKGTPDAS